MSELLVRVKNLAFGGEGVGEVEDVDSPEHEALKGITAFVPFSIKGELVRASLKKQKKNYLKTELLEVLEASSKRVSAPCPEFKNCGGCSLQHMEYSAQLEAKDEMIASAISSSFKENASEIISKLKKVESSSPFNYRTRISLHLVERDGKASLGFYQAGSREIVQISACFIASEKINNLIPVLQNVSYELVSVINKIEINADDKDAIAVFISPFKLSKEKIASIKSILEPLINNFIIKSAGRDVCSKGKTNIEVPFSKNSPKVLEIPAGAFSQVNKDINLKLIDFILKELEIKKGENIEDLYAGAGNFTIPAASLGANVISVEASKKLSSHSKLNAENLNLKNITVKACSVEKYLKERGSELIDSIIIDPPRSGLGPLVSKFNYAKKLALVSCDLASFTRDLKALLENSWKLKSIQPFDMFAQTGHIEICSVFEKAP